MARPLELLMLCDWRADGASTVRDHIAAIVRHSRHRVRPLSVYGALPAALDLDRFDGVVLHYSVMADPARLLPPALVDRLSRYRGLKSVYVQDEHRNVRTRIGFLKEIGAGLLFTCVPPREIGKVYPDTELPGTVKINVFTGYASAELAQSAVPLYAGRPIDVGYRARTLPPWLGRLGHEKAVIGRRFAADAKRYGLVCDISIAEYDRLYGGAWTAFLAGCKASLGSESGASVFDLDGSIERRVSEHLTRHPNASFEEVSAACFAERDGVVANGQVSPRIFEAAALRTLMILYPGSYSGVVSPWRHYVPLAKDHSNMDEVVVVLRSPRRAEEIIRAAYREVASNPAYSPEQHVSDFDQAVASCLGHAGAARAYDDAEWSVVSRQPWSARLRRGLRRTRDAASNTIFRSIGRIAPGAAERLKNDLRLWRRRLRRVTAGNPDCLKRPPIG